MYIFSLLSIDIEIKKLAKFGYLRSMGTYHCISTRTPILLTLLYKNIYIYINNSIR